MSAKQLWLIALGLVAALLLWGGAERLSRGSDTVTGGLVLPRLAPGAVDTIRVVKGRDSLVVAKQSPTAWTVNGHRAAPDAVNDLLRALHDSVAPELVAQDSGSFARLNVDSATGRWLRVTGGGKPLLRLIVGARGSEYGSAYVRLPGDAHVYLWRGRLASLADRTADDWRDKRITALAPDSIALIDVERGKDHYSLRRAGKRWTLAGGGAGAGAGAPDSGAVARLLEKYRSVSATGFASQPQADSARAMRPARRVSLRDARGVLLVALVFDSTASGFWVRGTGGAAAGEAGTVYRMNAWDVDGLTPTRGALVPNKK